MKNKNLYFTYINLHKKEIIKALVLIIFEAIFTSLNVLFVFMFCSKYANEIYYSSVITLRINSYLLIPLLFLICSILSFVFSILSNKVISKSSREIGAEIKKDCYVKILNFNYLGIDEIHQSSLLSRITDDNNNLQEFLCYHLKPFVIVFLECLFILILSLILELNMFIFTIILIVLFAIIFYISNKLVHIYLSKINKLNDNLNLITKEAIKNIKTTKSYVKEDYEITRFNRTNNDLKRYSSRAYRLSNLKLPLISIVSISAIFAYTLTTNNYKFESFVSIFPIITFAYIIAIAFKDSINLNSSFNSYLLSKESIKRITEILQFNNDLHFDNDSKIKIENGEIELNNISFKYNDFSQNNILNNLSIKIEKNTVIGLVGQTGSGKTTLMSLINRFYDAQGGTVLIDGLDITKFSETELRKKIANVFQNPLLFKGTIKENLAYRTLNLRDEDIIKACKIACCDDFIINDLPKGYDSLVEENGSNLSGGQKARIAIARAILVQPKILILDDSFASIDKITETEIINNIKNELKETTTIIISHKISTIKNLEKIFVLENGNISNLGTHDELYKQNKMYKFMCDVQNEGGSK